MEIPLSEEISQAKALKLLRQVLCNLKVLCKAIIAFIAIAIDSTAIIVFIAMLLLIAILLRRRCCSIIFVAFYLHLGKLVQNCGIV